MLLLIEEIGFIFKEGFFKMLLDIFVLMLFYFILFKLEFFLLFFECWFLVFKNFLKLFFVVVLNI